MTSIQKENKVETIQENTIKSSSTPSNSISITTTTTTTTSTTILPKKRKFQKEEEEQTSSSDSDSYSDCSTDSSALNSTLNPLPAPISSSSSSPSPSLMSHQLPTGDCTFCCDDLVSENYVEYQSVENGPWLRSQYCKDCIETHFISGQWKKYIDSIASADCAAALRRVLSQPPCINVKDAGLPCPG
jgi:hypothetical protein